MTISVYAIAMKRTKSPDSKPGPKNKPTEEVLVPFAVRIRPEDKNALMAIAQSKQREARRHDRKAKVSAGDVARDAIEHLLREAVGQ